MNRKAAVVLSVSALCGVIRAQNLPVIPIAASAGFYLPTSGEIRDLFGDSQFSVGLRPWNRNRNTSNGFSPEIDLIDGSNNGNKFFVAPIAVAYEKDMSARIGRRSTIPYIRASAGVAYFDYSITREDGVHYGLKRLGGSLGLEAGLKLSSTAKAFIKYDLLSTEQHFNFSGFQIGAAVSIGST
jgi:hypothetical protein